MNKSVLAILFVVFFSVSSFSQTILRNDGANIRVNDTVDLVIENEKFVNNGTFDA